MMGVAMFLHIQPSLGLPDSISAHLSTTWVQPAPQGGGKPDNAAGVREFGVKPPPDGSQNNIFCESCCNYFRGDKRISFPGCGTPTQCKCWYNYQGGPKGGGKPGSAAGASKGGGKAGGKDCSRSTTWEFPKIGDPKIVPEIVGSLS